jgi:enamine deaminase RidA (YjgF/YER057c/UK114 family)
MSKFKIEHKSPEGLFSSKAFSQAITVSGKAKTIYIGGQNAVNAKGELVGAGDLELQTKQALQNIASILASENASFANLVKLNIYCWMAATPKLASRLFKKWQAPWRIRLWSLSYLFPASRVRAACLR